MWFAAAQYMRDTLNAFSAVAYFVGDALHRNHRGPTRGAIDHDGGDCGVTFLRKGRDVPGSMVQTVLKLKPT